MHNRLTDYLLRITSFLLLLMLISSCAHHATRCCPDALSAQQLIKAIQFSGEGNVLFKNGEESSSFSFESLLDMQNKVFQLELSKAMVGSKLLTISLATGIPSGDAVSYLQPRMTIEQWRSFLLFNKLFAQVLSVFSSKECYSVQSCKAQLGELWQIQRLPEQFRISYSELFTLSFKQWEKGKFRLCELVLKLPHNSLSLYLKFN